MDSKHFELLKQIAHGIAMQFGENCEVAIHEVSNDCINHSIIYIENGQVSGRSVGDGASQIVVDHLTGANKNPEDHFCYLMKTSSGKVLKSSSLYIRDNKGVVCAILSINYDITAATMLQHEINGFLTQKDKTQPTKIVNVNDLLDDLIEQSVKLVGKPVSLMNKDDKVKAIQFLNESGAFLVTKSGDKVAKYFGISKYTLYSYIDANKQ